MRVREVFETLKREVFEELVRPGSRMSRRLPGRLFPPPRAGAGRARPVRWKDKGVRARRLLTANGDILVKRRYYWLGKGRHGCPADAALGVDEHGMSARAREACCRFGMMASFRAAVEELDRYAGNPISAEFLRQVVEREGRQVAQSRDAGTTPCVLASGSSGRV